MNVIDDSDIVSRNIEYYLTLENVEGGLLEDVEDIYASNTIEENLETPCVWIYENPTTSYKDPTLENEMLLSTVFDFVCTDYDEDLEIAQRKCKNLASRVCASILKNRNTPMTETDPLRLFYKITFVFLHPNGEVDIVNKNEKTPSAMLRLEFLHKIDWMKCCK